MKSQHGGEALTTTITGGAEVVVVVEVADTTERRTCAVKRWTGLEKGGIEEIAVGIDVGVEAGVEAGAGVGAGVGVDPIVTVESGEAVTAEETEESLAGEPSVGVEVGAPVEMRPLTGLVGTMPMSRTKPLLQGTMVKAASWTCIALVERRGRASTSRAEPGTMTGIMP